MLTRIIRCDYLLSALAVLLVIANLMTVKCEECECDVRDFNPMCGSDGWSYENECYLYCAKAYMVHRGPCREPGHDDFGNY
ncbi:serine protease inhibitor dipetalogastin-like [Ostrinia furnacalis]|uniref:serine protease inhibitor dipetalogastin-like n=1 Tax=Ostrinia furnacalis TaxID=93504 RepID=UPI00103B4E3E|nr:serine protease inhibitor dipetalogastin-like [Ostrinia furnacalis]